MAAKFTSIKDYIAQIPDERQVVIDKLRTIIKTNMSAEMEECLSYNMIGYVVPHSVYPSGYHCDPKLPLPFISLASQKNFIALYHMGMYASPELLDWFTNEYSKHCTSKLDMGKSCVRFKKMDDIPFDLIAELIKKMTSKEWIELYEGKFKK